jgi:hypothetical protein
MNTTVANSQITGWHSPAAAIFEAHTPTAFFHLEVAFG